MNTIERRRTRRTKLDKLAYIHIEPDNGGIILDASDQGLGFHSIAPVEGNGWLRFSLQEQHRRIDFRGELAWTDEMRNVGGVRFTALSDDGRNQILAWVNKPTPVVEEHGSRNVGSVLLRALPRTGVRMVSKHQFSNSFVPALVSLTTKVRSKLGGFSGGLATGLLFSALATMVVLFLYGHRRQLGESLIRLGEKIATIRDSDSPLRRPSPSGPAVASAQLRPTNNSAVRDTSAPHRREMLLHEPIVSQHQIPLVPDRSKVEASSVKPQQPKLEIRPSANSLADGAGIPQLQTALLPDTAAPAPGAATASGLPLASVPVTTLGSLAVPTKSELTGPVHDGNSTSSLQMFFDLGKFKQERLAQSLRDRVAQLGLRTSIVPRGHLWMSSYQVLVGPYNNDEAEKTIDAKLLSRGYKPRPFERGSHDFAFRSKLTIDGSRLPTGDLTISWESYVSEAKIKFLKGHDVIATTGGKWIKCTHKYSWNEDVYQIRPDGSRWLLEVHFAGFDRALVFRN